MYRADHTGARLASTDEAVFLSDKESIQPYTRGKANTISSYTTTKDVSLLELSFPTLMLMLKDQGISPDIKAFLMEHYIGMAQLTPDQHERLKSQGYMGPPKVAFVIPATPLAGSYTNRILTDIVCSLGYDGWIVMPSSLVQRNVDMTYYASNMDSLPNDLRSGSVRYVYNMYVPEVMFCKWDDVAKGGKRTRKTRRRRM